MGFSSRRITVMIQFLSSVKNCVWQSCVGKIVCDKDCEWQSCVWQRGRSEAAARYRPENKNPTQRCGEWFLWVCICESMYGNMFFFPCCLLQSTQVTDWLTRLQLTPTTAVSSSVRSRSSKYPKMISGHFPLLFFLNYIYTKSVLFDIIKTLEIRWTNDKI